jgi:hypothetical protein
MGRVVSATEARIHFGELMQQAAENHETIRRRYSTRVARSCWGVSPGLPTGGLPARFRHLCPGFIW